ncbi:MAG: hypothetical protein LBE20_07775 [Deltaproteobacteria bacterium]|jgi:tRNA A-37 threonylcarbamoyl transferase component Bud32|nr:hypothetical protein [Deltaproteobacteria bacterium]
MNLIQFFQYKTQTLTCWVNSAYDLNVANFQDFIKQLESCQANLNPNEFNSKIKLGRGKVKVFEIAQVSLVNKKIVMRQCLRGGLIGKILKNKFLNPALLSNLVAFIHSEVGSEFAQFRPLTEINNLKYLYDNGLNVPCPIGALVKPTTNRLFYVGYVATEFIENTINFLEFIKSPNVEREKIIALAFLIGQEAREMLELGVYHSDFHLGNLLVNPETNEVWIIDFDKSTRFDKSAKELYAIKLIKRFTRSAQKHEVTELIVRPFCQGIGLDM